MPISNFELISNQQSLEDFYQEPNFLGFFKIKNTPNPDIINQAKEKLRTIAQKSFLNNSAFRNIVDSLLSEFNFSELVLCVINANQIHIFTKGAFALVYRNNTWHKILDFNDCRTGNIETNDLFLVGNNQLLKSKELQNALINNYELSKEKLLHSLSPIEGNLGFGAIVKFSSIYKDEKAFNQKGINDKSTNPPLSKLNPGVIKKLIGLTIVLLVLFLIGQKIISLIVYQKYKNYQNKVNLIKPKIKNLNQLLSKDVENGLKELKQIDKDLKSLQTSYPEKKEEINRLISEIASSKTSFNKSKVLAANVFFDLGLIDKRANADFLSLADKNLAILDKKNKKTYLINIENKSYQNYSLAKIQHPEFIGANGQTLFVFDKTNGIYELSGQNTKKIVTYDKAWGKIVDFLVFNNNLYLLDQKKGEIYKYTPVEKGYSEKINYIQSGGLNLTSAKNIAIDFSVYLLTNETVFKFTGGLREKYILDKTINQEEISFIFKGVDNQSLYLLSRAQGQILVLNKGGGLTKGLVNTKLKSTNRFVAPNDERVLFLLDNKVYSLDNY